MTKKSWWRRSLSLAADYPLESGLAVWGIVIGPAVLFLGNPPSATLRELPTILSLAWGIFVTVASVSVVIGLFKRRTSPFIANAMYLYSAAFAVYTASILAGGTLDTGAVVAALASCLAVVCLLRGKQLRMTFTAIQHELQKIQDEKEVKA